MTLNELLKRARKKRFKVKSRHSRQSNFKTYFVYDSDEEGAVVYVKVPAPGQEIYHYAELTDFYCAANPSEGFTIDDIAAELGLDKEIKPEVKARPAAKKSRAQVQKPIIPAPETDAHPTCQEIKSLERQIISRVYDYFQKNCKNSDELFQYWMQGHRGDQAPQGELRK